GGLGGLDGREGQLQWGVPLDVLAVLAQRGGADGLELTLRQHRLEDARRVDGALGRSGAHQGVELVDEQNDVAPGADLLQHPLETLLEVTPVAGPREERAEIEGVELLAPP